MTLDELGVTEQAVLRKKAYWAQRQGYPETARVFCRLADILDRANEVRSDTLNGVINYILNGGTKMTVKELKDTISQYPDDARIVVRVIARNGRGGTCEEQLLLGDAYHDEKENVVYLNCGFEIGWLNAHPEFQPPAEPEAKTDDEARGGDLRGHAPAR